MHVHVLHEVYTNFSCHLLHCAERDKYTIKFKYQQNKKIKKS